MRIATYVVPSVIFLLVACDSGSGSGDAPSADVVVDSGGVTDVVAGDVGAHDRGGDLGALEPGSVGGPCYPNDTCDGALICVEGVCKQDEGPEAGSEGGPCYPNDTCDGALVCVEGVCKQDQGPEAGTEDGPCYPNDTCNEGLACVEGVCEVDEGPAAGSEGGPCLPGGACDGDLSCVDGLCVDAPLTCEAPEELCGEVCVDTRIDPDHCGACDRSCLGGGCVTGECQEAVLVSGLAKNNSQLVLLGDSLYVGVAGAFVRVGLPTGDVATLEVPDTIATQYVNIADGYLYAREQTDDIVVVRHPLDPWSTGSWTPMEQHSGSPWTRADHVFWRYDDYDGDVWQVHGRPSADASVVTYWDKTLAPESERNVRMYSWAPLVEDGYVYIDALYLNETHLLRAPLGGGQATHARVLPCRYCAPIGVFGARAVWADHDASDVYVDDFDSGANPVEIQLSSSYLRCVHADGEFIYAGTHTGIHRVPMGGGVPTLLIPEVSTNIRTFVLDDEAFYWVEDDRIYVRSRLGDGF